MRDDKDLDQIADDYADYEVTEEEFQAGTWVEPEAVPESEQMITYSIRLPKPVVTQVRRRAAERGLKPTAYLREIIEASLAEDADDLNEAVIPVTALRAFLRRYQTAGPAGEHRESA